MKCEEKLWYVYGENNKEIKIENALKNKEYKCPYCGNIVKLRGNINGKIKPNFYHVNKNRGESKCHKYWKENLIKTGDIITLYKENIKVNSVKNEYTININNNIYRPDILLKVNSKNYKHIIIEIFDTNKKEKNLYNKIYKYFKNTLVLEFNLNTFKNDKYHKFAESFEVIYDPVIQNKVNVMNNKLNNIYKYFKNTYKPEFKEFDYVKVEDILNKMKYNFDNGLNGFTERKCKNILKSFNSFSSCSELNLNYSIIGRMLMNNLCIDLKYCSKRNDLSKYYENSFIEINNK